MARLILIRHAQAEHSNLLSCDFERALTKKGCKDIQKTAEALRPFIIEDSICICSSARRAAQTWQHASLSWTLNHVQYEPSLYEADMDGLILCMSAAQRHFSNLMLIGHNPGMSLFLSWILGRKAMHMKTSTAAILDFDSGFNGFQAGSATLAAFITPTADRYPPVLGAGEFV